ncbi:MAG: O-antigen ligase family protein [Bacteroidota bacterium]
MSYKLYNTISLSHIYKLIFFIGLFAINISIIEIFELFASFDIFGIIIIIMTVLSVSVIMFNGRHIKDRNFIVIIASILLFYIYLYISSISEFYAYGMIKAYVGVLLPLTIIMFFSPYIWNKNEVLSFLLFSIIAISIFAIGFKINYGIFDREVNFGLFGPITYGWFMGFGILSVMLRTKPFKYSLLLVLFFFLQMIWTGSKGPLFAFLLIVIIYYRSNIINFFIKYYLLLIPIFLLIVFVGYFAINSSMNSGILEIRQISTVVSLVENPGRFIAEEGAGSVGSRMNLIKEAFNGFINKPLFGHGFGSFPSITKSHHDYPHNIFMELMVETGLLGLLFFIFVLGVLIYRNPLKWFGLFGILILSFSGDLSYFRYVLFILLIGHLISFSDRKLIEEI